MTGKPILILGGGWGGLTSAHRLRVSHAASEEGVAIDLERASIDFADRTAERVDRRSDGDVFEP